MKNATIVTVGAVAMALAALAGSEPPSPAERGMFGGSPSRNMVSDAKGLPDDWDAESGRNVLWSVDLGSQTYAGPVVAGGRVYVGTNNEALRHPAVEGDRGVLQAFRASDGEFLWQAAHAKLPSGANDWPMQGICSSPAVEGDRLYYVSNRAELVAADVEGFRDGENDGPIQDEARTGETDADLVWKLDMIGELGVFPHNMAASSPVVVGDLVYVVTSNGVHEDHKTLPSPGAPSFIAVDRRTGEVVWQDASPGEGILHGQWTNPSHGVIAGRPQVIFGGGDGWVYSFEPETGQLLWKLDGNPKDAVYGFSGTRNAILATPVVHAGRVYVGMGDDPEVGDGGGHLYAIDGSLDGDVTARAVVWDRGGEDFNRTLSTVAIRDGLLFAADLAGFLYCLDADTGEHLWTHDTFAAIWGSPFVADGKVYLGDEDGDVVVLEAGKTEKVIREINMGASIYTTPVATDGVLYVATRTKLFAISGRQ